MKSANTTPSCEAIFKKIVKLAVISAYNRRPEVLAQEKQRAARTKAGLNSKALEQENKELKAKQAAEQDSLRDEVIQELLAAGYSSERAEFATNTKEKVAAQALRFDLI